MLLLIEGFDYADAAHIFLHNGVERIIGLEHPLKDGMHRAHDHAQQHAQHRDHRQENQRDLCADAEGYDHREQQHERSADRHAQQHLVSVLHIGHVRGQARDDGGGGELIDVGKGEGLHVFVHILAQIGGKAHRGLCADARGVKAGAHLEQRQREQPQPVNPYGGHIALFDTAVDQSGHAQRDDDLKNHFQHRKKNGQQRYVFVLTQAAKQGFYHEVRSLLSVLKIL